MYNNILPEAYGISALSSVALLTDTELLVQFGCYSSNAVAQNMKVYNQHILFTKQ